MQNVTEIYRTVFEAKVAGERSVTETCPSPLCIHNMQLVQVTHKKTAFRFLDSSDCAVLGIVNTNQNHTWGICPVTVMVYLSVGVTLSEWKFTKPMLCRNTGL
jgi:hypothetical protein